MTVAPTHLRGRRRAFIPWLHGEVGDGRNRDEVATSGARRLAEAVSTDVPNDQCRFIQPG